ncbi:hypothetical protein HDV05_002269 [Chytridiales sp. JEL 0842]|nr:hypothetical protein HDV05_002269 [Chytridiales sp. JEL 0842]
MLSTLLLTPLLFAATFAGAHNPEAQQAPNAGAATAKWMPPECIRTPAHPDPHGIPVPHYCYSYYKQHPNWAPSPYNNGQYDPHYNPNWRNEQPAHWRHHRPHWWRHHPRHGHGWRAGGAQVAAAVSEDNTLSSTPTQDVPPPTTSTTPTNQQVSQPLQGPRFQIRLLRESTLDSGILYFRLMDRMTRNDLRPGDLVGGRRGLKMELLEMRVWNPANSTSSDDTFSEAPRRPRPAQLPVGNGVDATFVYTLPDSFLRILETLRRYSNSDSEEEPMVTMRLQLEFRPSLASCRGAQASLDTLGDSFEEEGVETAEGDEDENAQASVMIMDGSEAAKADWRRRGLAKGFGGVRVGGRSKAVDATAAAKSDGVKGRNEEICKEEEVVRKTITVGADKGVWKVLE